jgi:hypothetical protein
MKKPKLTYFDLLEFAKPFNCSVEHASIWFLDVDETGYVIVYGNAINVIRCKTLRQVRDVLMLEAEGSTTPWKDIKQAA